MTVSETTGKRGQPDRSGLRASLRLPALQRPRRALQRRPGGYTRILKQYREGDCAELAIIELVDNPREVALRKRQRTKSCGVEKAEEQQG